MFENWSSVFAGVTIFVVRAGLVAEGRLFMEPVDTDGGDIAAAVEELYRPPAPHLIAARPREPFGTAPARSTSHGRKWRMETLRSRTPSRGRVVDIPSRRRDTPLRVEGA